EFCLCIFVFGGQQSISFEALWMQSSIICLRPSITRLSFSQATVLSQLQYGPGGATAAQLNQCGRQGQPAIMIARRRLARVFGRTTGPGRDSEIGLLSLYGCDQQTRLLAIPPANQLI